MASKEARLQFYKDALGDYRWRVKAANGKVLAASSEGYRTKRACRECWQSVYQINDPRGEELW